jgi:hypothetical protein
MYTIEQESIGNVTCKLCSWNAEARNSGGYGAGAAADAMLTEHINTRHKDADDNG